MAGFLIAEEGPLSGLILRLEEGKEWILGRDPDVAAFVLEDPMVSRRHVICRLTPEGFLLENLSSVNPATQNGKVITEAVLLRDGDIIQIGSTFFRFTEKDPVEEETAPASMELDVGGEAPSMQFEIPSRETRWMIKVISGPNSGAEFGMQKSSEYILGKDPESCDIVFQDLSVSRQHARISVDAEEHVYIEDMGSRNGVLVNGELIADKRMISSQDLVALGTTSFLVIDREQERETIFSPAPAVQVEEPTAAQQAAAMPAEMHAPKKNWKELIIPTRHLVLAAFFGLLILGTLTALFALFKTQPIVVAAKNEKEQIAAITKGYPDIQFSFSQGNSKLFLVGHVLTSVEKQELIYMIKKLPYVESIDDNIVIDELVWLNMNALLSTNPEWQGVVIQGSVPGRFIIRGYLQTPEQAQLLSDYLNLNFPYLDRLDNQVVVENNLIIQIQNALVAQGFNSVTFQLNNGELVLSGRVDSEHSSAFNKMISSFKAVMGIRSVKNFVVMTSAETSRVDVSSQYKVSGYSKKDDNNFYVVINGRILSPGDILDGMKITGVEPNMVLLEKDGLKFRINYNLQ